MGRGLVASSDDAPHAGVRVEMGTVQDLERLGRCGGEQAVEAGNTLHERHLARAGLAARTLLESAETAVRVVDKQELGGGQGPPLRQQLQNATGHGERLVEGSISR